MKRRLANICICATFLFFVLFWSWKFSIERFQSHIGSANLNCNSNQASLTAKILLELRLNGTSPCHRERTAGTVLFGILSSDSNAITLQADTVYSFTLVSMTKTWQPRCAGGDYYETLLAGDKWRSRPKIEDLGNGSYIGSLMVPSGFEGTYNFSVQLLFDAYHGLDASPQQWILGYSVLHLQLIIVPVKKSCIVPELPLCTREDYAQVEWNGYWRRAWYNGSCEFDQEGRYKCLNSDHRTCDRFLCQGNVDRLESNGWVYSSSDKCKFQIWETNVAWNCLNGLWLFFWGDSNHSDTVRNLLLFVLGYHVPKWSNLSDWHLPRSLDEVFSNPEDSTQSVRITLVYNGHLDVDKFGMGLSTLRNRTYRELLLEKLGEDVIPDVIIMNSGLHDGIEFRSVEEYVIGIEKTISFWEKWWRRRMVRQPKMIYRSTIAPAGASRSMKSNPYKMEVFNKLMIDRVKRSEISFSIIDGFDLSFPWHFDNQHSDGGHYGRAPIANLWPWHGKPHYYFVDVMLAHMLLNVICSSH